MVALFSQTWYNDNTMFIICTMVCFKYTEILWKYHEMQIWKSYSIMVIKVFMIDWCVFLLMADIDILMMADILFHTILFKDSK